MRAWFAEAAEATFLAEADRLVRRYFEVEDPSAVHPVGLELKLEAQVDDIRVRGIIDRLHGGGMRVSLFIDPDPEAPALAKSVGAVASYGDSRKQLDEEKLGKCNAGAATEVAKR